MADPAFLASFVFCSTIFPSMCPDLKPKFADLRYHQLNPSDMQSPSLSDYNREAFLAFQRLNSISDHSLHDMLDPASIPSQLHLLQAKLSNLKDKRLNQLIISDIRAMKSKFSKHLLAHFLASQHDSLSFKVIPTDADTTFTNRQLTSLSRRLLLPILKILKNMSNDEYYKFICPSCNAFADWFGIHVFKCCGDGHTARTKFLHDPIVRMWVRLLRHAGYSVLLEPSGVVYTNDKRPDIGIIRTNGSQLFIDIRTCDPQIDVSLDECCTNPGHAARLGVKQKESSKISR